MGTILVGLGIQKVIMVILGLAVVGFILKKLFKLAITIIIIAVLIHYGLPILQSTSTLLR